LIPKQKCKIIGKFKKMYKYLLMFFAVTNLFAQEGENPDIEEKLGEIIPLDIEFLNSDSTKTTFKELMNGKPTVLSLVYYKCPGLCAPLLNNERTVVQKVDLEPGIDYNMITVSFNPDDTPKLATDKKKNYFNGMDRKINPEAWHWLVGDYNAIQRLTESVGFRYRADSLREGENDYVHSGALVFLSPEGKITRYLMYSKSGEFLPFNFKMAAIEAAKGTPQPTLRKVLELCFKYDPEGQTYKLAVTRVAGAIMLVALVIFILWSVRTKKSVS
jgi:protein SCO1/2